MKRKQLFNYIEEQLSILAFRVERRGRLNILDLHLHSENFYRDFFNLLFEWNLENLNEVNQNVEAIDLIDRNNQIVIQVSSTNTKQKIDKALTKHIMAEYIGWSFKFISIARSAGDLKEKAFTNKYGLLFNPQEDIYDIDAILRKVLGLTTEKLQAVADFIKSELGNDVFTATLESDLAKVILMLTKIDASEFEGIRVDNEFQIDEKIDYNSLSNSVGIIKEYNVWQTAVRRVYETFDAEGMNKSFFVLQKIRSFYLTEQTSKHGDALFDAVRNDVKTEIINHAASGELSYESIDICTDVLVVDAFIRCKIFENPKGYNYVIA
jgi:hypothetical protein